MKGYKPKYLRQKNFVSILNLFKTGNALSTADIQQYVELSKTTINNIINSLVECGILRSIGKGQSTNEGGKRPMLYELNEKHAFCVTVMSHEGGCILYITDMKLNILCRESFEYGGNLSYEETIRRTADEIMKVLEKMEIPTGKVYGIAYHCGGIVNSAKGVVLRPMSNSLPDNAHIGKDLDSALSFHVPILIENSARCAGNFELLKPKNQAGSTILVINITIAPNAMMGTGIGGSLIINGQMAPDTKGYLSEIGHTIVDVDSDIRCKCGNCGCLETFIETKTVSKMIRELLPEYPEQAGGELSGKSSATLHDILKYAKEGNELANGVCSRIVNAFAAMLHNMILGYGPEKIIMQSEEEDGLMEFFINKIRDKVSKQTFFEMEGDIEIDYSHGKFEMQSNLGAASFCRDYYLQTLMTDITMQEAACCAAPGFQ